MIFKTDADGDLYTPEGTMLSLLGSVNGFIRENNPEAIDIRLEFFDECSILTLIGVGEYCMYRCSSDDECIDGDVLDFCGGGLRDGLRIDFVPDNIYFKFI